MTDYNRTDRIDLSSMGALVAFAWGKTRPTTGWTSLAGIKNVPAMNEAPENIDATTLDELVARRVVQGLKAAPSATNYTANLSNVISDEWIEICDKYDEYGSDDPEMQLWICITIPRYKYAFYFTTTPSRLDVPNITVGSVIEIDLYMTPTSDREVASPPASIAAWSSSNLGG